MKKFLPNLAKHKGHKIKSKRDVVSFSDVHRPRLEGKNEGGVVEFYQTDFELSGLKCVVCIVYRVSCVSFRLRLVSPTSCSLTS